LPWRNRIAELPSGTWEESNRPRFAANVSSRPGWRTRLPLYAAAQQLCCVLITEGSLKVQHAFLNKRRSCGAAPAGNDMRD
jgi:hypothetical protein